MRARYVCWAALAIVALIGSARAQGIYDRHVVILAIDGLRADSLEAYAFQGKGSPPPGSFLRELSRPQGEYRKHLNVKLTHAVFPSYTVVAWASIFTGVYPGKTGIAGHDYYLRDLDAIRAYDNTDSTAQKIVLCQTPDMIKLNGWDQNCTEMIAAMAAIVASVKSGFAGVASVLDPNTYLSISALNTLVQIAGTGITVQDFFNVMDRPYLWVLIPVQIGPFTVPIPWKFNLFDLKASGGIQNGDLLAPTLYDFAAAHDFKTFNVHNFFNRSNLKLSGQRISWDAVYGSELDGLDSSWGRYTWKDIFDMVKVNSKDFKLLDEKAVPKAIDHIQKNGMPHILTLYFSGLDTDSHAYKDFGHASVEDAQLAVLQKIDKLLIPFVQFLKARPEYSQTIFLLIADHGHTPGVSGLTMHFPEENYRVMQNGYMVHVYIRNHNGKWTDPPDPQDIDDFMNKVLSDPGHISLADLELVLRRGQGGGAYEAFRWNGTAWSSVSLEALEDMPELNYMAPDRRIRGLNNVQRSGDVILLPRVGIGKQPGASSHGGLSYTDSSVPFYIFGVPVSAAQDFQNVKGPLTLCGASHVDVTPTVLNLLNVYEPHKTAFDGLPVMNKDVRINFTGFNLCRGSGASDFLVGRWKKYEGESTDIVLENPSSVSRDALLLYYDWDERFRACQIVRLTPHDLAILPPPTNGSGPVEIRAAPLEKERRTGGLVGHVRLDRSGMTTNLVQLNLENLELFNVKPQDLEAVRACACDPLLAKKSPLPKLKLEEGEVLCQQ